MFMIYDMWILCHHRPELGPLQCPLLITRMTTAVKEGAYSSFHDQM